MTAVFSREFLDEAVRVAERLDTAEIENAARTLATVRARGGRLFLIGSGGGAGHASHAACDFRKVCGFEAYCPTDNVSELTARINDEGWETSIANYLAGSRFNRSDALLVFSVGGGDADRNISANLVCAMKLAREKNASIVAIVGRDGGFAASVADACIKIPVVNAKHVTPHTEAFQAVVWHLLVSHPVLQQNQTMWESTVSSEGNETVIKQFETKIFADGADLEGIIEMSRNPLISGFTTNPTLMRKAGVEDYKTFAKEALTIIRDKPVSFEVFSDDFDEMERQALEIASWGENVYVKIPVTNTKGESSAELISRLAGRGVKLNVTAVFTLAQVNAILPGLSNAPAAYISIFAGRIADTGVDPLPLMRTVVNLVSKHPQIEVIWASPRELLNITHANQVGCHVITVTNDILKKLPLLGKDHTQYSLETVHMFYDDAKKAGYTLEIPTRKEPAAVLSS